MNDECALLRKNGWVVRALTVHNSTEFGALRRCFNREHSKEWNKTNLQIKVVLTPY